MAKEETFIDYYELLGVSSDSQTNEIRKAYKKLALQKHPDKNPNNPNAGAEFAILVEAKEILSDASSRSKYDNEYRAYCNELERVRQDQMKRAKMSNIRKEQIIKLIEAEKRAKNEQKNKFYKMHIYKTKQNSIKEELEKFRKLIKDQKDREMNAKIEKVKNKKKSEKIKKRTLIIKLDQTQCTKMYKKSEIESIFKIYGKIMEIDLIRSIFGAQIIFSKSKYVQKALRDAETLKNEFFLLCVDENNQKRKVPKNEEEEWRQFVKQRANMNHLEYQQFIWNKVEKFIEKHSEQMDVDTDDHNESNEIIEIE